MCVKCYAAPERLAVFVTLQRQRLFSPWVFGFLSGLLWGRVGTGSFYCSYVNVPTNARTGNLTCHFSSAMNQPLSTDVNEAAASLRSPTTFFCHSTFKMKRPPTPFTFAFPWSDSQNSVLSMLTQLPNRLLSSGVRWSFFSFYIFIQFPKYRATKDVLIGTECSPAPSSGLDLLCQQVKERRLKSLPRDFHVAYTAGSICFLV